MPPRAIACSVPSTISSRCARAHRSSSAEGPRGNSEPKNRLIRCIEDIRKPRDVAALGKLNYLHLEDTRITDAGLAAIGVEPEGADSAPTGATEAPAGDAATDAASATEPAPNVRTPREGTKQALLIEMLRAEGGATIAEIVEATGWQPHTVRGAIAGALKKKLGLDVTSEKVEGRGRVYKLPPA